MNYILKFTLFLIVSSYAYSFTILIDPGHGGEDNGAQFQDVKEKNLSLAISQKLAEELSHQYNVFLTRSVDRTVSLPERALIAEKVKADLFISVHINSSPGHRSFGFETYYLDNGHDVAVKKVEKTENIQGVGEEIVQQILIDLVVEQTVTTSKPLAAMIHAKLKEQVGRKYHMPSRGIKPGLFYVLALSKRPGVLLEVGFLSTAKERARMQNEKFQWDYAKAVANGITNYLTKSTEHRKI